MSRASDCKANLLIKAIAPAEGYTTVVNRGELGMKQLGFGLIHLSAGECMLETGDCEHALDILNGTVSVDVTSAGGWSRRGIGERRDFFDGPPTVIYVPSNAKYRVTVERGPVDIAVFSAFAPESRTAPTVISPKDVRAAWVGRDGWRREIYTAIGDSFPASKLILGETSCAGTWSGYPPHKHDAFNPPDELPMDEIYHFRITPEQGFAMMRIYTPPNDPGPMDEGLVIRDGDTVVIPRGYHTVSTAPGYVLRFVWALAGDIRRPSKGSIDPRHSWLEIRD